MAINLYGNVSGTYQKPNIDLFEMARKQNNQPVKFCDTEAGKNLPRKNGKQADRHKSLDIVQGSILDAAPSSLILYGTFKSPDHQPDHKQCPAKPSKKSGNCIHPRQVKQFHSHIVHHCKKIIEKSNDLPIQPVDDLV